MPLYDNPPHRAQIYTLSTVTDSGGGTSNVYTLVQANAPCFAPTIGSSEQERQDQMQIVVNHDIHFKASALTTPIVRGMKLVVNGASLHVLGINVNQAAGTIPSLVKVTCESLA